MTLVSRPPCDEGVIGAAAPATDGCAESARPWVLAATILGSSMAFIDGSVVNVALPAIQAALEASVRGAQWVVNAYLLMLGALILVGGAIGDRFGRRRIFTLGIAVFTVASIGCGLAPSTTALIAARAVQGIGGALMVPSSLAIISATFPEKERGRAIGTWAGFSALTTAFGPVLGGWLVDSLSWRAIFLINVPIAAITLALAFWRIPESRNPRQEAGVDWRGGALATLGLGAIAYGLTTASELGWTDPIVLGVLFVGALVMVLFVWSEAHAPTPMMPLSLFRSPAFSGANTITLFLYFALSGALFFLPFNLIQIQGYSAAAAGASFLPFTLIMGGLSRWSGGLINRYGARTPLIVGPIVAALGFALLALPGVGGSYWTTFFLPMTVLGFGMAIAVAPLTTTVMTGVGSDHAGTASGINNAVSRIAGMLAIALLGAIAVGIFGAELTSHVADLRLPPDLARAMVDEIPRLAEAQVPQSATTFQQQALHQAIAQSFLQSFRIIMLIAAALALASAVAAALTIPRKPAAAH